MRAHQTTHVHITLTCLQMFVKLSQTREPRMSKIFLHSLGMQNSVNYNGTHPQLYIGQSRQMQGPLPPLSEIIVNVTLVLK